MFTWQAITRVEVKKKSRRKRNALIGLGAGAGVGLGIGLATTGSCTGFCIQPIPDSAAIAGSTVVSALLGALVGWHEAYRQ
jgi:predicted RNA methylase